MPIPTYKNRVGQASATVGTGTLTLGAAESGYQALATGDNGLYFDVVIEDGTAWEVARECLYTHSGTTLTRGTLEASSTGSAISLSGSEKVYVTRTALREQQSLPLEQVALADAATTMVVNSLYVGSMAAWATADRTYTLPAVAAVGDRVGIMLTGGNDSYELLITAASGDTLNGVAGGTEWSRIFITNEVVIIRCVTANSAWVIDIDGRIAQSCDMELTTAADGESAATFTQPTAAAAPGAWTARIDNGSIATVGSDRITIRRGGNYITNVSFRAKDAISSLKYISVGLFKSAGVTLVIFDQVVAPTAIGAGTGPVCKSMRELPLVVGDYLVYKYRTEEGGIGAVAGSCWFGITEVI